MEIHSKNACKDKKKNWKKQEGGRKAPTDNTDGTDEFAARGGGS